MRCGAALGLLVVLAACGVHLGPPRSPREYTEALFARKPLETYTIQRPLPGARDADTVVGEVDSVTVEPGDTLLDIARLHDLGYEEIVAANPGVDPWVPTPGTEVVLPTAFVLPCCRYEGLVVNVPEMRLYAYAPGPDRGTITVRTYPVGLGRSDFRTPIGSFRVAGKTVNPTWNVPDDIRREHMRERGDPRRAIAGGDPDNPLGKYRLELDRTLYRIHGTNFPWGVGRQVSHGCAQLYPEDMEQLFPLVAVGTPVEFVYQPVKVGRRDGDPWIQVHRDIYRRASSLDAHARKALKARGIVIDPHTLRQALRRDDGVARPLDELRVAASSAARVEP